MNPYRTLVDIFLFLLAFLGFDSSFAQSTTDSLIAKDPPLKYDSTQSSIQNKVDSVAKVTLHLTDRLNPNLSHYNRKLDSIKGKLTRRIDSLKRLNLPTSQYTHLLDSIERAGPLRDIRQAEANLALLQNKVNEPVAKLEREVNQLENKINQKLNALNKEGAAGTNLPGNVTLSTGRLALPNAKLPSANLNLPSGSIPRATNPLNSINGLENQNVSGEMKDVGKAEGEMKNITSAPQQELGKLKSGGELGQAEKELGQVKQLSTQAKVYSKDLKNLSQGNLDSVKQLSQGVEKKAMQMGEMKGLQGEMKQVDQYKAMAAKTSDPEVMQQLALQEVRKEAVNHFAGREKEIQAAMAQLTSLKKKYTSLQSIKDLPKHVPNEMHGKPFVERLLPGLNFQFQKKTDLWLDFNPYIGYRITGRFASGLGWNERIGINTKKKTGVPLDHIYGLRSFAQFRIKDGVHAKVEIERMNAFVPPSVLLGPEQHSGRQWVMSYFAGMKKDFRLGKTLIGNVQVLYNLYNPHKMSPYLSNFNVRMGFEFPINKRPKEESK